MSVVKRFGLVGAILAGDFLHARAMDLVGRLGGPRALGAFVEATLGMVDGEFIQLRHAGQPALSEEQYFAVVRGKTGLLISAACAVGGIFAGADAARIDALRAYGAGLGSAFQVIDDLLDYQGDGSRTGKTVGNDWAEGKVTLPLICALSRSDESSSERIVSLLSDSEHRAGRFDEVYRFIDDNGGFVSARHRAEALVEEGVAALAVFGRAVDDEALQALTGLAHYVLSRRR